MTRRIMLIDLDAFFVSVEQILNPALKGKPVVVGGRPDRRGVVASGSYEARKFGIYSGMPLMRAYRLCPQAIFVEGNFANYRDYSHKFMMILADFTPELEPAGLDEAYLDVTGFESLHGSIHGMAVKIKERLKNETGLTASVGIAGGKSIAKVASEKSKPDGLLEVPAGLERDFLAPLPVGDLPGIGKKSEQVLSGLDIGTIGQLASAHTSLLKSRFGVWGELIRQRALGIDESKVETQAARSISRETTFAKDTRDVAFLKATLRYLGERVGSELRESGKESRCVTIKVRYADFTTISRQQSLKKSGNSDDLIFNTGVKLLEASLAHESQAVRLIGIGVSNLTESGQQLNMLNPKGIHAEQLNKAIDRIRDRYGFTSIQTGRTLILRDVFQVKDDGYRLDTPSLSR